MKDDKRTVEKEYLEFVTEVANLDEAQLKARIVQLQQALSESEAHKEENEELNSARDEVSLLSGPYRDVKKAVRLKTEYILGLLKERGNE